MKLVITMHVGKGESIPAHLLMLKRQGGLGRDGEG